MQLGFVTAILPDLSFEEVVSFAASAGYKCIEVMCWPVGKAERRYAGVTHIDVGTLDKAKAAQIQETCANAGITISGLGYYPNPLVADLNEGQAYIDHIKKVIDGSALLGVNVMNTFVGRDPVRSVDENWPRF